MRYGWAPGQARAVGFHALNFVLWYHDQPLQRRHE